MARIRDNERYELPQSAVRWTARRKTAVVLAVASGRLPIGEVQRRYNISVDEFADWQRRADQERTLVATDRGGSIHHDRQ